MNTLGLPDFNIERQRQMIMEMIDKERKEHWTNVNMNRFKEKVKDFFKSIHLREYKFQYYTNTTSIIFPTYKTEIQIEQLLSITREDQFVIRIFKESEIEKHYIEDELVHQPPIFSFLSQHEYVCKETQHLFEYFKKEYYLMHKLNEGGHEIYEY